VYGKPTTSSTRPLGQKNAYNEEKIKRKWRQASMPEWSGKKRLSRLIFPCIFPGGRINEFIHHYILRPFPMPLISTFFFSSLSPSYVPQLRSIGHSEPQKVLSNRAAAAVLQRK
jgi:hypothetical protein